LCFLQTIGESALRLMTGRTGNTAIGAQARIKEQLAPKTGCDRIISNGIAAVGRKIGKRIKPE
jgi:hypothetical protein